MRVLRAVRVLRTVREAHESHVVWMIATQTTSRYLLTMYSCALR